MLTQRRMINTSRHYSDLQAVVLKNQFFYGFFFLLLVVFPALSEVSAQEGQPQYQITSPVSGVVKKIYVKAGQIVQQDELLLEFDSTLIDSDIKEAKAQKTLASVSLKEAKKELERSKELYERTVLSDHELQKADISYNESLVKYATANNQLTHAQWIKDYTSIRAPFKGQIVRVLSYQGQYINNKLQVQVLFLVEKVN